MTSYGETGGHTSPFLLLELTVQLRVFLRFSTSNLQNTVTAISGFLLTYHSKYIVLIDFERNGALG